MVKNFPGPYGRITVVPPCAWDGMTISLTVNSTLHLYHSGKVIRRWFLAGDCLEDGSGGFALLRLCLLSGATSALVELLADFCFSCHQPVDQLDGFAPVHCVLLYSAS